MKLKHYTLLTMSLSLLLTTACMHEQRPESLQSKATMWIRWNNGAYKSLPLNDMIQSQTREDLLAHGDSGTILAVMDYSICYHNKFYNANMDAEGTLWASMDFAGGRGKPITFFHPQSSPIDTLPGKFYMVPRLNQWGNMDNLKSFKFGIDLFAVGQVSPWEKSVDRAYVLESPSPKFSEESYSHHHKYYYFSVRDEIPDAGDSLTLNGRKDFSEEWFTSNETTLRAMHRINWPYKIVCEVYASSSTTSQQQFEQLYSLAKDQLNNLWDRIQFVDSNLDQSHVEEPLPNPYTEGRYRNGFIVLRVEKD